MLAAPATSPVLAASEVVSFAFLTNHPHGFSWQLTGLVQHIEQPFDLLVDVAGL